MCVRACVCECVAQDRIINTDREPAWAWAWAWALCVRVGRERIGNQSRASYVEVMMMESIHNP